MAAHGRSPAGAPISPPFWANPQSGFRFGIKRADGTLEFNTAAWQNTGTWTHLSVTNSFTLAVGDTVFVECDTGTVSGLGDNQVFAMFDGVELVDLSTSVGEAASRPGLHTYPDPAQDRLWVAADEPIMELRLVTMSGAWSDAPLSAGYGTMAEVDVAGLSAGAHVLWARTASGVRTARFVIP